MKIIANTKCIITITGDTLQIDDMPVKSIKKTNKPVIKQDSASVVTKKTRVYNTGAVEFHYSGSDIKEFPNVKKAAEYFGVAPSTIRSSLERGSFRRIKCNRI